MISMSNSKKRLISLVCSLSLFSGSTKRKFDQATKEIVKIIKDSDEPFIRTQDVMLEELEKGLDECWF